MSIYELLAYIGISICASMFLIIMLIFAIAPCMLSSQRSQADPYYRDEEARK